MAFQLLGKPLILDGTLLQSSGVPLEDLVASLKVWSVLGTEVVTPVLEYLGGDFAT